MAHVTPDKSFFMTAAMARSGNPGSQKYAAVAGRLKQSSPSRSVEEVEVVEAAALLAPALDLVVDPHGLHLGVHHAAAVAPEIGFLSGQ